MKIIAQDNFNRDNVDDVLVCVGLNEFYGRIVLKSLQDKLEHDGCDRIYSLVEDDYKLYKFDW